MYSSIMEIKINTMSQQHQVNAEKIIQDDLTLGNWHIILCDF